MEPSYNITVQYTFKNVEDAMTFRETLKKHHQQVTRVTLPKNKLPQWKRIQRFLQHLDYGVEYTSGHLYKRIYKKLAGGSYRTFQRDMLYLVVKGECTSRVLTGAGGCTTIYIRHAPIREKE